MGHGTPEYGRLLILILQLNARADGKVLQVVRLNVAEDHRIEQHLFQLLSDGTPKPEPTSFRYAKELYLYVCVYVCVYIYMHIYVGICIYMCI